MSEEHTYDLKNVNKSTENRQRAIVIIKLRYDFMHRADDPLREAKLHPSH